MKRTHRRTGTLGITVIAGIAAVVLSLTACSGSSSGSGSGSKGAPGAAAKAIDTSAVLRIGTTGTVESLNPFVTDDTLSADFFQAIYPHLVQYDLKTTKIVPDFATAWSATATGKQLTFTLKPGATWSDGAPLGAADIAWTINLMIKFSDDATSAWAGAVAQISKATAVNATTLQVDYKQPVANALPLLARIPVLPKQYWAQYATGNGKALTKVSNAPTSGHPLVSGGPFVFAKYVDGQSALFSTNPRYYGSKPKIAGFGVQFFANDDAEVSALKSKQLDLAMGNPSLPPTDVAPLKRGGFRIVQQPSVSFDDVIINANSKKITHRELLNPAVRKAFEYATDRSQIDSTVLLGYASPGASIIPPATGSWHDPSVTPLPFDVAKANSLLDAAGFAKGSNGVRVADGHPMSYEMLVSPDVAGGLRMAQLLTQTYAQIGVKLNVKQLDDDALTDAITSHEYTKFDLALWGWDTEIDPDYMLSGMTCAQYDDDNDSGYCNAAYDKLYAQQQVTVDPAARQKIVYAMQQQIATDRPYILLHYLEVLEGWSQSWSTVIEGPTGFLSQFSSSSLLQISKTG